MSKAKCDDARASRRRAQPLGFDVVRLRLLDPSRPAQGQREIQMGGAEIRVDPQSLAIMRDGGVPPSGMGERATIGVLRFGRIGFQRQRPLEMRHGFVETPAQHERKAPTELRVGVAGIEGDRAFELRQRLGRRRSAKATASKASASHES